MQLLQQQLLEQRAFDAENLSPITLQVAIAATNLIVLLCEHCILLDMPVINFLSNPFF